uniref:Uncharacterized protein n=1 Tax=Arundo donax TaxID=35708 RepID=A0A0A9GG72_ARUDO
MGQFDCLVLAKAPSIFVSLYTWALKFVQRARPMV